MYVLSWRTVSALTRVLFLYLFPSLLHNSGNKHKNNPLVSVETVLHSSIYIILHNFVVITVPANGQHNKALRQLHVQWWQSSGPLDVRKAALYGFNRYTNWRIEHLLIEI